MTLLHKQICIKSVFLYLSSTNICTLQDQLHIKRWCNEIGTLWITEWYISVAIRLASGVIHCLNHCQLEHFVCLFSPRPTRALTFAGLRESRNKTVIALCRWFIQTLSSHLFLSVSGGRQVNREGNMLCMSSNILQYGLGSKTGKSQV